MSEKNKQIPDRVEIRIVGVSRFINDQLNNIADNSGLTKNELLKSKLPDIIQSFPENMRKPKDPDF